MLFSLKMSQEIGPSPLESFSKLKLAKLLFCKGPDSKYRRLAVNVVSVATPPATIAQKQS